MRRFWHSLLIFLGVSGLPACGEHNSDKEAKTMVERSYPDAQSYCIGRFLVELPPFVSLTNGDSRYDGVSIEVNRQAKSRFKQMVDKEIAERKEAGRPQSLYYESDKFRGVTDVEGRYLIRFGRSDNINSRAYVNISDTTWRLDKGGEKKISVANHIEFRPEPGPKAVPEGKGYCIMYGFVSEKGTTDNEWENRLFRVKGDPEFRLAFEISMIGKRRDTLSEREEAAGDLLGKFVAAGKLRYEKKAEDVSLGFIDGEQSIADGDDESGRLYTFVGQGNGSDPEKPFIQIDMASGTMGKEDADKLWYSILGSLRPRPGAF